MSAASLPFGAGSLTADSAGAVKTTITFSTQGTHVVTLTGMSAAGAPVSLSATVTVRVAAASGAASGTDLPRTGFPIMELALGALGLVLLGGLVVALVRRHRRAAAAAPVASDEPAQPLQPTH
jgi:LPXTG-motif cell wall-anchored protein